MTITAPRLDPRVIGLAHYAGRAVLESVLIRHGLDFQQQITLRLVAVADGPLGREQLVGEVVSALKVDEATVRDVVDRLIAAKLVEADGFDGVGGPEVRITDAGRELFERVSRETGAYTARIYAGIPGQDLETAGRALTLITERANAALAAVAE
ncbi:winged helix-turn-helix transcriptional regulator [Streptomyces sp. MBT65]|uniref:MarR family winged helix-turn-helix transcriptional regulator n=1 Tax=Streptomyces sp. MBT65 TaxID=1488395 RepID=UPI00190B5DB5|nr:MarR family winged helix-turn-helix transcriptional regulator [Streptomyces sp. MBT65]MBK3580216.1 winged helix-turn-helix transcriptional regulator [Streptomyces sp. MBT65]